MENIKEQFFFYLATIQTVLEKCPAEKGVLCGQCTEKPNNCIRLPVSLMMYAGGVVKPNDDVIQLDLQVGTTLASCLATSLNLSS